MPYETIAVSLFARLPMPTLLAACGFACHVRTLMKAHLSCILLCVFPQRISSKRETAGNTEIKE